MKRVDPCAQGQEGGNGGGERSAESRIDAEALEAYFPAELDAEGWMSERPRYWLDLPDPEPPTRAAWLRHRLMEAASFLLPGAAHDPWTQPRLSEEEWIRLSEQALGPLPRAADVPQERKARSAAPNARESARKPEAYSPGAARSGAQ